MRGGYLPPALLCAALGFALAFAPGRIRRNALALTAALAVGVSFAPIPAGWSEGVFLGCWISVIAAAASVHLPGGVGERVALALAANTGLWTGAVIAVAGTKPDLAVALACTLLMLPAAWLAGGRGRIAVKVAASWLIAVSLLAGALQITTPTPGYKADHME